MSTLESEGQSCWTFRRAACRFRELKALDASTKITASVSEDALMVQISVCQAHVRIILKVNQQQDRNEKGGIISMEELTEERTIADAIAVRVRDRRTEARRQRERERHRQRRVAGQVAFTKLL